MIVETAGDQNFIPTPTPTINGSICSVPSDAPLSDASVFIQTFFTSTFANTDFIVAYALSHGTTNPLEQNDATVLGLLAVVLAVIGVGLFVKKGIERLLRFWIARVTYEQSAQTDRLIEQGEQLQQLLRDVVRDRETSAPR